MSLPKYISRLLDYINDTKIDFMSKHIYFASISTIIILLSIISLFYNSLNYGVDFSGGYLLDIKAKQNISIPELRDKITNLGFTNLQINNLNNSYKEILLQIGVKAKKANNKLIQQSINNIKQAIGPNVEYRRIEVVWPRVSKEMIINSVIAITLALSMIAFYIWIRFEWQFAFGAIISLLHDIIIIIGLFSIAGLTFDLTIVAAILTIAGYSINDTIICYDHLRYHKKEFEHNSLYTNINISLNRLLVRTVITSLTTLLAALAIYICGSNTLSGFAIALIAGIIAGNYSSIAISMPMLIYLNKKDSTIQSS